MLATCRVLSLWLYHPDILRSLVLRVIFNNTQLRTSSCPCLPWSTNCPVRFPPFFKPSVLQLTQLSCLAHLDLSSNCLSIIPDDIAVLAPSLTFLDVSNNSRCVCVRFWGECACVCVCMCWTVCRCFRTESEGQVAVCSSVFET